MAKTQPGPPKPLSAAQINVLAKMFALYSKTEEQAREATGMPDDEASAQIHALSEISVELANTAAATAFNDTAAAFQRLQEVTTKANVRAKELAKKIADFSKIVGIATALIGLGTSFGSSAGKVLSAAADLAGAIKKTDPPAPTSREPLLTPMRRRKHH